MSDRYTIKGRSLRPAKPMSDTADSTVLFGAVDVLGEACEKLLASKGYDTWTDEHLEIGLERAFAPEILEEIRLVQLAREALRMTNCLRTHSPNAQGEARR